MAVKKLYVGVVVCSTQAEYDELSQPDLLNAALIVVDGKIVKNKIHPEIPADNAIAIAEEAFKTGFGVGYGQVAGIVFHRAVSPGSPAWEARERAWDRFEPSEAMKDLTSG